MLIFNFLQIIRSVKEAISLQILDVEGIPEDKKERENILNKIQNALIEQINLKFWESEDEIEIKNPFEPRQIAKTESNEIKDKTERFLDFARKNLLKSTEKNFLIDEKKFKNSTLAENSRNNNSKFIPTNMKLFKFLTDNLNQIVKNDNYIISGISIYKNDQNKFVDFWGLLEFSNINGKFVDSTGIFVGKLFNSFSDLISNSKMSNSGFFFDKSITEKEESENLMKIKNIIAEIAEKQKIDIKKFLSKNSPKINSFDQVILYNAYPLREDDILDVCVCSDSICSEPCKEIRKVERKNLK